ncbi:hypothetical protein ABPG75_013200 [Micractinium tetrahymenae]
MPNGAQKVLLMFAALWLLSGRCGATLAPGNIQMTLRGRDSDTCRRKGFLCPQTCNGRDTLHLKSVGGGPFATWDLQAAPGEDTFTLRALGRAGPPFQSCGSYLSASNLCTNLSVGMSAEPWRWRLEAVPGKPGVYRVRSTMPARLCPRQYLGAREACNNPALGMYSLFDSSALTEWSLSPVRPASSPVQPS